MGFFGTRAARKVRAYSLGLTLLGLMAGHAAAATIDVRFEPAAQTASVADTFDVQIIADIAEPILGFGFELTFDDRSVNVWLAALPHMWPEVEEALPPQISNPAVGFEEGELRLGAHYTTDRWQAIVSLGLGVEVSRDRGTVNISLDGAYAGS